MWITYEFLLLLFYLLKVFLISFMILCRDRYLYLWDNPKNKKDFCADLCCLNVSVLCCTDVEVKLRVSKLLSGALWCVCCNLFGVLR